MKSFIKVSEENQTVIKNATIGAICTIGVFGCAAGLAKTAAVYGVIKTGAAVIAAGTVVYAGHKLNKSEQTVDMLIKNVQDKVHSTVKTDAAPAE